VQLLFYNRHHKTALVFNGHDFYRETDVSVIPKEFKLFINNNCSEYVIDGIKNDDDIFFVRLANGAIFQIGIMPYGYDELRQVLFLFTRESAQPTPMGISDYEAAAARYSRAAEIAV